MARKTAQELEADRTTQIEAALPKGITLGKWGDGRGKPWYVRHGVSRQVTSYPTERERNDAAEKLVEKVTRHGTALLEVEADEWREFQEWKRNRKPAINAREAVEKYMALRLAEDVVRDSDTHIHLSLHLEKRFVGKFGDCPLDTITTEQLREWFPTIRGNRTGELISKVTIKHHRKDVNTFFKRAVDEKWCSENPCRLVKPPKIDDEEKIPLKPREIFDLLKHNRDQPVLPKMALELFGGLRASSAARTQKEHVDYTHRGITMPGVKHKSGKRKYRQGHPPVLWEWLARANDATWHITVRNYDQLKGKAFIRAHVKNPGNTLRHSFASYLLAQTKDMGKVGYLMQHTRASTTEEYEGIATEADAQLVLAMTPDAVAQEWETFLATVASK